MVHLISDGVLRGWYVDAYYRTGYENGRINCQIEILDSRIKGYPYGPPKVPVSRLKGRITDLIHEIKISFGYLSL